MPESASSYINNSPVPAFVRRAEFTSEVNVEELRERTVREFPSWTPLLDCLCHGDGLIDHYRTCPTTTLPNADQSDRRAKRLDLFWILAARIAFGCSATAMILENAGRHADQCGDLRYFAITQILMAKCALEAGKRDAAIVHVRYGTGLLCQIEATQSSGPGLTTALLALIPEMGNYSAEEKGAQR